MLPFRSLLLSFILSLAFISPVLAQEYFEIDSFHASLQIQEDSSMIVTEEIKVNFSEPRHGIFRDIDTEGVEVKILDVTGESGENWPYQTSENDGVLNVKIGDPNEFVADRQVYKIRYEVKNAIRTLESPSELSEFEKHDELYWNVTGNRWPVSIQQASATVELPASLFDGSEELALDCFTGSYESDMGACDYERESSSTLQYQTNDRLYAYQGLTILLGMSTGKLKTPSPLSIDLSPAMAEIYVDGELKCEEACDIFLPAGPHELRVEKWGYQPFKETIEIKQGEGLGVLANLKALYWLSLVQLLLLLVLVFIALEPIYTFWKKGRDPKGRGTIVPEYDSPDGLIPAEMGTLYDEKVHMRDLTSTLIDLCVRGYMKIKVLPKAKGVLFKKDDYELIRTDNKKGWGKGLTEFEKLFMKYIFKNSGNRTVSSMYAKFYTHLPSLKEMLYKNLVDKGYMPKSPDKIRSKYRVKGFLFLFLCLMNIVSFVVIGVPIFLTLLAALLINAILTLILASFMPQKTLKGRLAYERVLGFKLYLETAEKDRLKFQEKEHLFYEFLPYAMTLDMVDKWSKAFEGIYKTPPDWYMGGGTGRFSVIDFSHDLNHLSTQMGHTLASVPSNSGSGGSSGFSGGFSGGGFGGGGGGSW